MPRKGSAPGGRNKMTGAAELTVERGGVTYTWRGQRVLQQWQAVLDASFTKVRERAIAYWRNEEWTKERHPYMKGTERDSGFFNIRSAGNLQVELEFGATAPWTKFEEFGTARGNRVGHHPIRNTLDRVGYRVTDVIRAEAKKAGL